MPDKPSDQAITIVYLENKVAQLTIQLELAERHNRELEAANLKYAKRFEKLEKGEG